MDPGPSPRSAPFTGTTPRALGRARAVANAIGEEVGAEPTLEQALRMPDDDDSPALAEARAVLERESCAPIGVSTLMCWRPGVGACAEPLAQYAHREAKPAAAEPVEPEPAAPAAPGKPRRRRLRSRGTESVSAREARGGWGERRGALTHRTHSRDRSRPEMLKPQETGASGSVSLPPG